MNESELEGALDDQISTVLNEMGEVVTKYVTVVESIDEDGQRWLRVLCSNGATTWDRMGMFGYAMAEEQAFAAAGQA